MKSFSELTSASQVNNGDLLAISQTSGNGYASKKTTVKDITDKSNLNLADEYDSTSTYAVDDYVIYESVLYKCIGTTTGTFDSTKWTSVVVTDEMGSGGGGTGGHTIIDENGNSMTARSGLQFFGAVEVTDDSANNRTLVEVLGGDFYNPVIYSTEEREIGVWTDGKPLYQKTLVVANVGSVGSSLVTPIEITDIPFDFVTVVNANIYDSNDNRRYILSNLSKAMSDRIFIYPYLSKATNPVTFYASLFTDGNTYSNLTDFNVTIQYTKSTDTAGSGSWTPQGVPAVHYSTDEQVIGTWNGETLYEKTIISDLNLSTASWQNYISLANLNLLFVDKVIITRDGEQVPMAFSPYMIVAWIVRDNYLKFIIQSSTSVAETIVLKSCTIQYTKSS